MSRVFINSLIPLDESLSNFTERFLKPYQIGVSHDTLTQLLPQNIKILIYLIFTTIPFLILKFLYPYSRMLSIILFSYLFFGGMLLFAIFIGFFDLLFAY
ncbi:hypothetical protein A2962_02665 [Candidatus Woesebacteria bacterium RIFCSPLOWO2_01_FULL_39_61]|uniref:Uncharacterized protein n=1 Tax=Candidatus Woesebacteria bacterium RIFCSPHIGHO2_02_FULL_39_13 TaxID=1802505 RepID=A0A1F7Z147_9BACT|nr:MAG: hypothetical protein A2692_05085 [Candidatus Woesebacteria bacterium RIFCSPHIGHO2_01_FULL_39_95]OGM33170.1 MAG: hypothetical protein A3D01_04505 [Candidatus Woesebacteria bacterium RIFCSPHIGHO2_02_FULL_39_13]OGM36349.1 MAG: hypothetical protein A3E13_02845 [Candidatus Woesebacteria bacterium RIFCSPHIGHO2_12_FULL_40_20]OGM67992.1 MAG: hypothetical protein A2962_02665 [Candidatus Woesebacteria bacterium RIFCSPLOWO2_01_FULL_39_61]OGM74886.1 MAG: hypothetical protein A3H19_04415 [Candidatus